MAMARTLTSVAPPASIPMTTVTGLSGNSARTIPVQKKTEEKIRNTDPMSTTETVFPLFILLPSLSVFSDSQLVAADPRHTSAK
jgi:hypothetical protein